MRNFILWFLFLVSYILSCIEYLLLERMDKYFYLFSSLMKPLHFIQLFGLMACHLLVARIGFIRFLIKFAILFSVSLGLKNAAFKVRTCKLTRSFIHKMLSNAPRDSRHVGSKLASEVSIARRNVDYYWSTQGRKGARGRQYLMVMRVIQLSLERMC